MFLSLETTNLLKNFASINQSILIQAGNKLRTMSVMKTILAEATIPETFDKQVAIYDLSQFLNALSLLPGADVQLKENSLLLVGQDSSIEYRYSDPNVITAPPDKQLKLPSEDVCFILTDKDITAATKVSGVLQAPDIFFVGENGEITLQVKDKKNSGSNSFRKVIGETPDTFSFNMKVENLKLIPSDYDVVISKKLLARFESHSRNVTYFITLDPDSTFEASNDE